MSDQPIATITSGNLVRFVTLGIPAIVLWAIGGIGALSLFGGLANGTVSPGENTAEASLMLLWGSLCVCAVGGIGLGMVSLLRQVRTRILVANMVLAAHSLFFSVLT